MIHKKDTCIPGHHRCAREQLEDEQLVAARPYEGCGQIKGAVGSDIPVAAKSVAVDAHCALDPSVVTQQSAGVAAYQLPLKRWGNGRRCLLHSDLVHAVEGGGRASRQVELECSEPSQSRDEPPCVAVAHTRIEIKGILRDREGSRHMDGIGHTSTTVVDGASGYNAGLRGSSNSFCVLPLHQDCVRLWLAHSTSSSQSLPEHCFCCLTTSVCPLCVCHCTLSGRSKDHSLSGQTHATCMVIRFMH